MREYKPSNVLLVSVATLFAAALAYTIYDLRSAIVRLFL